MSKINSFSFQGVNGAYSELAGKKIYPDANSIACKTFEEMFDCVRENKADIAIETAKSDEAKKFYEVLHKDGIKSAIEWRKEHIRKLSND